MKHPLEAIMSMENPDTIPLLGGELRRARIEHRSLVPVLLLAALTLAACSNVRSPDSRARGLNGAIAVPEESRAMDAIRSRIALLEKALREGDANAYAASYTAKASYLNTNGQRVYGRSAIAKELAGLRAGFDFQLPIANVEFLSMEVAVVDCEVKSLGSRATYVMVRENETWMIAAGRILPAAKSP